jgi:hypothetical protein
MNNNTIGYNVTAGTLMAYTKVASFVYGGTSVDATPTKIYFFLYGNPNANNSYRGRIVNPSDPINFVIAETTTGTGGLPTTPELLIVATPNIVNLPAGQTVLEIQIARWSNGTGTSSTRIGITTFQMIG